MCVRACVFGGGGVEMARSLACIERDGADAISQQRACEALHQRASQADALPGGVHRHVPDGGAQRTVATPGEVGGWRWVGGGGVGWVVVVVVVVCVCVGGWVGWGGVGDGAASCLSLPRAGAAGTRVRSGPRA